MGQPKAWLDFGPEKLLERVVRLASQAADPIVIVAAQCQELPSLPQSTLIARDAAPGRGPLEGLLAGLAALPEGSTFAYVTATDVPFLDPAYISFLSRIIGDSDLAIPYVDGRYHPFAALYRVGAVRPAVKRLLAAGHLRLSDVVDAIQTRLVSFGELAAVDPGCRSLYNVNTPDDYLDALKQAGLPVPPGS